MQSKVFTDQSVVPHKLFFCHGLIASFLPWKEVHLGIETLTKSALISRKFVCKIIDLIIQTPFVNF